jgi:hypothetical protein
LIVAGSAKTPRRRAQPSSRKSCDQEQTFSPSQDEDPDIGNVARSYFSLIGGAIFSAGAGGNDGAAPVVCPAAPGCAGWGDISVGRTLDGAGSAGVDGRVSAPGVDCSGCVACAICELATCELATCELRAESSVSERPEITSPEVMITAASQKSL